MGLFVKEEWKEESVNQRPHRRKKTAGKLSARSTKRVAANRHRLASRGQTRLLGDLKLLPGRGHMVADALICVSVFSCTGRETITRCPHSNEWL
jgi:hypothetical protein